MASAFFDLSALNGSNGFTVSGLQAKDSLGRSISNAGDMNGDGIADLIFGADGAANDFQSTTVAGSAYVVFGSTSQLPADFSLTSLNGSNGFAINGITIGDSAGYSVSDAGDVNADGISDIIIGARSVDAVGDNSGQSYVIFGRRTPFPSTFNLVDINGTNGFTIDGIAAQDRSGRSVNSAGDVNGDGIDDFVIGARFANSTSGIDSGQSYVIFGKRNFPNKISLANLSQTDGFIIDGIRNQDGAGYAVNSIGDLNADGVDDLVVGTPIANVNGQKEAGQVYVIFGTRNGFPNRIDPSTLSGTSGFTLSGLKAGDQLGFSVSDAGDVNNDGIDDLILGAAQADPGGRTNAGQSYVIFGRQGGFLSLPDLTTLDGSNGFVINGIAADDRMGVAVSSAGDINNDGIDDFLIGASDADPNSQDKAGQVYLIFGRQGNFSATLELSNLDTTEGVIFNGTTARFAVGRAVSKAGDLNKDGIDDFVIGTYTASPREALSGQVYVVYGFSKLQGGSLGITGLTLTPPLIDASGVAAGSINVDLANTTLTVNQAPQPFTQTVRGFTDVIGTVFNDQITGSDRPNNLSGNVGNDAIFAGAKDDILTGGAGSDRLEGGTENDRYLFDADTPLGTDTLTDTSGVDTLDFSQTSTQAITLNLRSAKLQVINTNHQLKLSPPKFENATGGSLADKLTGNPANNILVGNAGNDRLIGGAGRDRLIGGAGNDQFIFDLGSRFNAKTIGVDRITDFARSKDKLALDRTTFSTLKKGRLKSFEKAKTLAQARTSDEQIVYIRKTGNLFYNVNGDKAGFGQGGLFVDLKNGLNLTVRDFVTQA